MKNEFAQNNTASILYQYVNMTDMRGGMATFFCPRYQLTTGRQGSRRTDGTVHGTVHIHIMFWVGRYAEGRSLEIDRNDTADALSRHANMRTDTMMEGMTELSIHSLLLGLTWESIEHSKYGSE